MAVKTLAFGDDPLALATGSAIVLVSMDGGPRQDHITSTNEAGQPFEPAAVKAREEGTVTYEVRSGTIAIPFGAATGKTSAYMVLSMSVLQSPTAYVQVTVNWIKPSAANMIYAYEAHTETITGGTGIRNLFGATLGTNGCAISCSMSLSGEQREALTSSGTDYCHGGLATLGYRKEVTLEASAAITIPAGGYYTAKATPKKSRDGWDTHSASWFAHPNLAT
jgi:hypothetical protein